MAIQAKFTIPGRLPGLNELISAMNANRYQGAGMKKQYTKLCAQYAIAGAVPVFNGPVLVAIWWYEANRRRDIDNVAAGVKFILDGLVVSGKLRGDGRQHVQMLTHYFPDPDKKNPRVEVVIADYLGERSGQ